MLRKFFIHLVPDAADGNGGAKPHSSVVKTFKPSTEYKEPPKEVLAQPDFNAGESGLPSLSPEEGGQVDTTKQAEDTSKGKTWDNKPAEKKEEVKKEEVKQEEKKEEKKDDKISSFLKPPKKKEEGEKKEEVKGDKQFTPPIKKEGEFDYKGYSDSEVKVLKNMSKESREFTSNLIKQNRELSKLKGSSYLQHPQGYLLSPEYNQLQQDHQLATWEANYWNDQLIACKAGKKVVPLQGFDKTTGKPVYGAEMEPSDMLEEKLRLAMNETMQAANGFKVKLNAIPEQYKNQVKNDLQAIEAERNKKFAWVSNPELLDYSVDIDMPDGSTLERSLKDVKQDFHNLFPVYMRGEKGVEVASDLMVALIIQGAQLKEALAKSNVSTQKLEEVKRAEPSSVVKPQKEPEGQGWGAGGFKIDTNLQGLD